MLAPLEANLAPTCDNWFRGPESDDIQVANMIPPEVPTCDSNLKNSDAPENVEGDPMLMPLYICHQGTYH